MTLGAIREYRRATGHGLAEGKAYVDGRSEELQPVRQEPPARPELSQAILAQLTEIADPELVRLQSICSELERVVHGQDYQVTIAVAGRAYSGVDLPLNEVMASMYPNSKPHLATLTQVDLAVAKSAFAEQLNREGDFGTQFTPERRARLNDQLLPSFMDSSDRLMPPSSTSAYHYNSDVGLPGYHTYWYEAFLLQNVELGRIVVLSAVASD